MKSAEILELKWTDEAAGLAALYYRTTSDEPVSIIVLNELGQTAFSLSTIIQSDSDHLILDLSSLPPGKFNAWIECKGKTSIHPIAVTRKKESAFLDKMKSFFGL